MNPRSLKILLESSLSITRLRRPLTNTEKGIEYKSNIFLEKVLNTQCNTFAKNVLNTFSISIAKTKY